MLGPLCYAGPQGIFIVSKRVFIEDGESSSLPPPPLAYDAPARPKVMRRPLQFSHGIAPIDAVPEPAPKETKPAAAAHSAERIWQDDPLFGLVLILALAGVNLVLMLLVPYLNPPKLSEERMGGTLAASSSMPPEKQDTTHVTTYADPAASERLTNEFDLNRVNPEQNELSVSPKDIPPPRARALDNSGQ